MSTRIEMLQRLMNLYAAVEQMHSSELQRLTIAVREVQQAIAVGQSAVAVARIDGRRALMEGDRVGWMMSQTQQETAGCRRQKLEVVRADRQGLSNAAREQYVASRLKKEQMRCVFEKMEARIQMEEGRRVQSSSDDLFLSRQRWVDAKEKTEGGEKMKAS